ncbi:GGDEF domain-containing protein [Pseudohoeflea suaedae]|nr:GGDEF domain-containing protein [Pseudohoeflea suaedae]
MKRMKLTSQRQVLTGTLLITLISVASPVSVFMVVLSFFNMESAAYWLIIGISAAIPLLIAPPIALIALSLLRMISETIEKVDAVVRRDPLTGVSTRAFFLEQVREHLANGGAFLMIDADHFKSINDTDGHDVGDAVLRRIAEIMSLSMDHAPGRALIGRLGGEEFGVFLEKANEEQAALFAAAVGSAIRLKAQKIPGCESAVTVSIGVAVHAAGDRLEQTMKRADVALYQAKNAGRDRFILSGSAQDVPARLPQSKAG